MSLFRPGDSFGLNILRIRTYHNVKFSAFPIKIQVIIKEFQIFWCQFKIYFFTFSFFDEYFLNDYVFSDHTPGFAGGISLRRTDCSIRAILAYEMLSALGFQCGTETILAYKDGKPIPGVLGHIYNFIDAPGKGRLFFDFSRSSDETFRFESAEPIVTTYRAGDARIEVRTTLSSSDPGDVYGQLVAEPVIDDARNFCAAFQKHGGTLAAFLFDNPDQIAVMQRLRWFSEQVDQIFKKNQTTAWIEGTQDSIRSIYPALFP